MYPDEVIYAIALSSIFRYRVEMPRKILESFGSAGSLFSMERDQLEEIFGKTSKYPDNILSKREIEVAQKEIEWCNEKGIKINYQGGPDFPEQLTRCPDAPLIFYSLGNCNLSSDKIIAIVGTRQASARGVEECKMVVRGLAESGASPVIASGLAYGIDITAHESALEYNLETIAVLANPLDRIYPKAHTSHARKIVKQGALITEFPRNSIDLKLNFVQRNRLIAGLSKATIVVESRKKGGALTTAELADSYSREVFALPGRITDIRSEGCNNLIAKNEALIYTGTDGVLAALGWQNISNSYKGIQGSLFYTGDPLKEKILVTLKLNPGSSMDELHIATSIPIKDLAASLLELEVEGYAVQTAGRRYMAK